MKAVYHQKGDALDYMNKTDEKIEHGDVVVMGERIGVAGADILPGEVGALHVAGVYSFNKANTEEITVGTEVFYTENGISSSTLEGETGCKAGYAAQDSPTGSAEVNVKINA